MTKKLHIYDIDQTQEQIRLLKARIRDAILELYDLSRKLAKRDHEASRAAYILAERLTCEIDNFFDTKGLFNREKKEKIFNFVKAELNASPQAVVLSKHRGYGDKAAKILLAMTGIGLLYIWSKNRREKAWSLFKPRSQKRIEETSRLIDKAFSDSPFGFSKPKPVVRV